MQRDFSKQMPKAGSMAVFSFRNVNKLCHFQNTLDTHKTRFKHLSQANHTLGKREVWIPDLQGVHRGPPQGLTMLVKGE